MRLPLVPVRLSAGAVADVRVIDDVLTRLGAALNTLALAPVVRLLREPVTGRTDAGDLTDLGMALYAESIQLTRPGGTVAVVPDPQWPAVDLPGVVTVMAYAADEWLPDTTHPSDVGSENLAALRTAYNRLVERMQAAGSVGVPGD